MQDVERTGACRLADWHSYRALRDASVRPERGDFGERLRLPEGDVALQEVPGTPYWSVTMHWRGDYGSRVLHVGTWRDAMLKALEIQAFGPVGGPDYRPGPLTWVQFDDTERASVPQGELVIVRCSDQALLFHVAPTGAFRFLGVGTREQLRQTAFYRLGVYCSRPVSVVVAGRQVSLRFGGAVGILGFHAGAAAQEAIYLAYLGDGECAVLGMTGIVARLSLQDLAGTPPPEGSGPTVSRKREDQDERALPLTNSDIGVAATSPFGGQGSSKRNHAQTDGYDELLPRHFRAVERGCRQGDGKVRARECLALFTQAWRQGAPSFHGTPSQCYRSLCNYLDMEPRGSERSIRDAFALLARLTQFVCRDAAGQWWLPFEEIRCAGSKLMQWVADHTPSTGDESWIRPCTNVLTCDLPVQTGPGGVPEGALRQATDEPAEVSSVDKWEQARLAPEDGRLVLEARLQKTDTFRQASPRVFRSLLMGSRAFQPLYGSNLGDSFLARAPPKKGGVKNN